MSYVYLSVEDLIAIHETILDLTGGTRGILNRGVLESCCDRPKLTVNRSEVFTTVLEKAAAIMECIIKFHPFADGNKRTGIQAVKIFLDDNGWDFRLDPRTIDISVKVASCELDVDNIKEWLIDCADLK